MLPFSSALHTRKSDNACVSIDFSVVLPFCCCHVLIQFNSTICFSHIFKKKKSVSIWTILMLSLWQAENFNISRVNLATPINRRSKRERPVIAGSGGGKGQEVWSPKEATGSCSRCISPIPCALRSLRYLTSAVKSDFSRCRRARRAGKEAILLPAYLCWAIPRFPVSGVGPGRTCTSGATRMWQQCGSAVKPLWQGVTKGLV